VPRIDNTLPNRVLRELEETTMPSATRIAEPSVSDVNNKAEKPVIFISASSHDYGWRNRLKRKIDAYADQIEWWDDSKTETGSPWKDEIEAAIARSRIDVLLLSRSYLASNTATIELSQLNKQRESRGLRLFPIILQD